MKLEQLFNRLIGKGWKPRGKDQKFGIWIEISPYKKLRLCLKKPVYDYYVYSYRDLVSKESGLWQFVCENKLIEMKYSDWAKNPCIVGEYPTLDCDIHYGWDDYHHWLMESALCDEDKLEQFLIDNIKI